MTIFEDFLEYYNEDNPKLKKDIEIWLADFFDLPNRIQPVDVEEKRWVKQNLSEFEQIRILGRKI